MVQGGESPESRWQWRRSLLHGSNATPKVVVKFRGRERDSSPFWSGKVVALDYLVQHRPPDQKVPSWNLITATVSRLNSKLCTVIWRPSVQGLTESPVIRNASYYRSPKSYLNRSLMWLWFPRTICCYCSSALLWVRETNQSCFQITWKGGTGKQWSWSDIQAANKCKFTKNKQSFY